jgi:hypothetical protein
MMQPRCDGKRRESMAVAVSALRPVAPLPLILGRGRQLVVAPLIDALIPPHPARVRSGGRGGEALVLAILDGPHALSKVGPRLGERGMGPPSFSPAEIGSYSMSIAAGKCAMRCFPPGCTGSAAPWLSRLYRAMPSRPPESSRHDHDVPLWGLYGRRRAE